MERSGIDASRLDLAREFKAAPLGFHSLDLRYLLAAMRSLPTNGNWRLLEVVPGREWMLARLMGNGPYQLERLDNVRFSSLEEAEWEVFRLRWEIIFDEPLDVE